MQKQLLTILKVVFFSLLGFILVWLSFKDLSEQEISSIKNSMKGVNLSWLGISFLIGIISHVIRAYRWNMLVEPMGYQPRFMNSFHAVMVGYLVNFGVPRLGEISRCTLLTRYEKIPFTKTLGTIIAERVLDVFLFFVVFFIMLISQYSIISTYFENHLLPPFYKKIELLSQHKLLMLLILAFALAVVFLLFHFRKKIGGKFVDKLRNLTASFGNGLTSVRKVKKPKTFIFLTVMIWVCYYAGIHLCFYCLPLTENLGFSEAITAFVFGSITVMITPGGIGAYPYALQKILLLVYFVPEVAGASIGWLSWLTSFTLILGLGLFSLIALPLTNKNYEPVVPTDNLQAA
jgi:glycosyltransferase 2 family protein